MAFRSEMSPREKRIPTFALNSARDLFAKLQRDAELLDHEVTSDRFFNFVVTARHLAEWADKDPSVPIAARKRIRKFTKSERFLLCRDLANACKHFVLRKSTVLVATRSARGYGVGRYGHGGYGVGEEEITLAPEQGEYDAIVFAREIVAAYGMAFGSQEGSV